MATTATTQGTTSAVNMQDPFAAQRTADNNPFATSDQATVGTTADGVSSSAVLDDGVTDPNALAPPDSPNSGARRMSREWDAAKVPPSQFQKRKGSIYATPGSRDSHHQDKERDTKYHEKLKEKGWGIFGSKK